MCSILLILVIIMRHKRRSIMILFIRQYRQSGGVPACILYYVNNEFESSWQCLMYNYQPVVTVSLKDALLGMLEWMKSLKTRNGVFSCGQIVGISPNG